MFSNISHEPKVKIDAQFVPKRENLKYFGSILQRDGEIDDDITHRIGTKWLKWRRISGVICDKNVLLRLKNSYKVMVILTTLLYEA
uniref:Reverse transcriptase n=1 Tax=Solanum tuberosum TaxID=4113 RepID=M1A3J0_SOLTU